MRFENFSGKFFFLPDTLTLCTQYVLFSLGPRPDKYGWDAVVPRAFRPRGPSAPGHFGWAI